MQLLSADHQQRLEAHLHRRTREVLGARSAAEVDPLRSTVADYALDRTGKRVRPQLVCWTALAGGVGDLDDVLLDVAAGWELFHAFLLAHDDIIDQAGVRRSRPSLHKRLATIDGQTDLTGEHLGIVAGDMLFAAAMRLWLSVTRCSSQKSRAKTLLETTGRISMETGVGQASDIVTGRMPLDRVTPELVLDGYRDKTAAYTFEGPMLSGAILAGLDAKACDCLSQFAIAIGQAYQVHNDLLDLATPLHEGSDLLQGKRTLPLVYAFSDADDATRQTLVALLNASTNTDAALSDRQASAESLRQQLGDAGAMTRARSTCAALLDTAAEAARHCDVPASLQTALSELLEQLRVGYFR
ncbi:MAG: polyprenyl synthetase family protein [Planctomycetota bacterium]